MERIILIILGLAIILFSFPKISAPIMARLYNEGAVVPKIVKAEDAEIIKFAGPQMSLFIIGAIFTIIGVILWI